MRIVYNNIIPFKGRRAVNLFGIVFARKEAFPLTPTVMHHKKIHTAQMRELLYVGFYIIYLFEGCAGTFANCTQARMPAATYHSNARLIRNRTNSVI